jgi:protein SCO1/2
LKKVTPEDFLHSENVYLIDGEQKLRGVYQGRMASSLEELARDAETLVK